jgi:hypothetical protein
LCSLADESEVEETWMCLDDSPSSCIGTDDAEEPFEIVDEADPDKSNDRNPKDVAQLTSEHLKSIVIRNKPFIKKMFEGKVKFDIPK